MSRAAFRTRLALALAVGVLALAAAWLLVGDRDEPRRPSDAAGSGATGRGSPPALRGLDPEPEAPDNGKEASRPERPFVDVAVEADGAPAPHALVRVAPPRSGVAEQLGAPVATHTYATDETGSRRIVLPADWDDPRVQLSAESADQRLSTWSSTEVPVGARAHLALRAAGKIDGVVIGGSPTRRHVSVYSPSWPEAPGRRELAVDEEGRFTVSVPPGFVTAYARSDGYVSSAFWRGHIEGGQAVSIRLELGPAERVRMARIVIATESGSEAAYPAGSVVLVRSGGGVTPCTVGEGGRVPLRGIAPGDGALLQIWGTRRSDGTWANAPRRIRLDPAQLEDEPVIRVRPAANTVFRVVDVRGKPISSLPLTLLSRPPAGRGKPLARGPTDAAGHWTELSGKPIAVGDAELQSTPDRTIWTGRLSSDPDVVRVSLDAFTAATLRLVDFEGRPTTSRYVFARPATGPNHEREIPDPFDSELGSNFGASPTMTLLWRRGDPAAMVVDVIEKCASHRRLRLSGIARDDAYVVPLSQNVGSLRVRLLDSRGEPVRSTVHIRTADSQCSYTEPSDPRGVARFVGIPPGSYRVFWLSSGEFVEVADASLPVSPGLESEHVVHVRR